jgi:predicted metal-dependent phosphoesterase TrpH
MTKARKISWLLVLAAVAAGTLSDSPRPNPPLVLGGYRVLAADFHVHSFPLSWATLGPLDTVLEARFQGLDVIAMTGHNHVWVGKAGKWFSRFTGGPRVLVGEEIVTPGYHLLAIGIKKRVSWNQSVADAIDEVHKQGGVAIAAHPLAQFWPAYDARAMSKLDAAEVLHPIAYRRRQAYSELKQFYSRARLTAIGDSDFHGLGPMGLCRTWVFAREDSERSILEALRERRTVVFDREGNAFGDPDLIDLARQDIRFTPLRSSPTERGWLAGASRIAGLLGLLGIFLIGPGRAAISRQLTSAQ